MSNKEQLEILGNVKEVRDAQHSHIDLTLQHEEAAGKRDLICRREAKQRERSWRTRFWVAVALIITLAAFFKVTMDYTNAKNGLDAAETASKIDKLERKLEEAQRLGDTVIWFDRNRNTTGSVFTAVDDQYPAAYERWGFNGYKDNALLERWHWRIEGNEATEQFGDLIHRCKAVYNSEGNYIGYEHTIMPTPPTDEWKCAGGCFCPPVKNSIKVGIKNNRITVERVDGTGIKLIYEDGEFKYARKIGMGMNGEKFRNIDEETALGMFLMKQVYLPQLAYLRDNHEPLNPLASMAYQMHEDFANMIDAAPQKTQEEWERFAKWIEANPGKEFQPVEKDQTLDTGTAAN
jgi:hypothetical protein